MAVHNPGVRHGTETHCPQDHPYEGGNLIITVTGGRACRECKRADSRDYSRRRRLADKARKAGASEAEVAEIMLKKPGAEAA
jgi:hypothetical protein